MASLITQLALLVVFVGTTSGAGNYTRLCYYGSWAIYRHPPNNLYPEGIDPFLCTHLLFAFSGLDKNTTQLELMTPEDEGLIHSMNKLKKLNPELKTLLSVGGWTFGSHLFSQLVSTQDTMDMFADNALSFLREHNFDGLDLDWEYPAARGSPHKDKTNYIHLLKTLRGVFENDTQVVDDGKDRLLLTAAVGVAEYRVRQSYNIHGMNRYLDLIMLMTYDFHGTWDNGVNVHSALYSDNDLSIEGVVKYWLSHGAPKEKLVVGIPLYGNGFDLANETENEVGAAFTGGVTLTYFQICKLINRHGLTPTRLDTERVPFLVHNTTWVGFDDATSIREKAQFIKDNDLSGGFVWAVDLDDSAGECGDGRYPLLNALKDELIKVDNEPIVG